MLTHPTLDKLHTLKLFGMYQALSEQFQMADITALSFEERFGLLVESFPFGSRGCTSPRLRRAS